jgi:hypothetical protein
VSSRIRRNLVAEIVTFPLVYVQLLARADYQVADFIVMAEYATAKDSDSAGLGTDTIEKLHIKDHIATIIKRRFSYEDFWRLLARSSCQKVGGWDSANNWGWTKMTILDMEKVKTRKHWYSTEKLTEIFALGGELSLSRSNPANEQTNSGKIWKSTKLVINRTLSKLLTASYDLSRPHGSGSWRTLSLPLKAMSMPTFNRSISSRAMVTMDTSLMSLWTLLWLRKKAWIWMMKVATRTRMVLLELFLTTKRTWMNRGGLGCSQTGMLLVSTTLPSILDSSQR